MCSDSLNTYGAIILYGIPLVLLASLWILAWKFWKRTLVIKLSLLIFLSVILIFICIFNMNAFLNYLLEYKNLGYTSCYNDVYPF